MQLRQSHGSMAERNRLEYEKRVNRVTDHIRQHLAEELTLATLARVAACPRPDPHSAAPWPGAYLPGRAERADLSGSSRC